MKAIIAVCIWLELFLVAQELNYLLIPSQCLAHLGVLLATLPIPTPNSVYKLARMTSSQIPMTENAKPHALLLPTPLLMKELTMSVFSIAQTDCMRRM